ncbi:MAG TPA: PIN domain-containing protein [Acidimicrobiales bacterium]|nr:PIN domain-containing protein [Acidimicrobiales bacterium]
MIVDTGVLVAAADRGDAHHERCAALLADAMDDLIVPVLAVAEVAHFLGRRLGSAQELAFVGAVLEGDLDVEPVEVEDWPRITELVRDYADLGLGTTDASLVAAAERLGETVVASLDHRHLATVRPRHCAALTLLP